MSIEHLAKTCINTQLALPLFSSRVPAGFPSPADDFIESSLDLNEHLITHPSATFFCRVSGDSMIGLGIFNGDLLVIDRALEPKHHDVVLAAVDGELTCKLLDKDNRQLLAANKHYPAIAIRDEMELIIEGVVTHSIKAHRVCSG
jgi:DNA polymerase V